MTLEQKKNKKLFFLIAQPRSGNTLLASILNQNPDIACTGNSITLEIIKRLYLLKEDELEKELLKIEIDEKTFAKANMQLTAKDRMREIKLWSTLKKEFDDGTFDTQDVNRHQLESYHQIMKNKAQTLSAGSSQPEIFNVLGQLNTIERVKKSGEMIYNKKEQLTSDLGAKEK